MNGVGGPAPLCPGPLQSILVTGAGGLIGAEVVRQLAAAGFNPLAPGRAEADLTRPGSLAAWPGSAEAAAVVHCAAVIPGKNPGLPEEAAARLNRLMDEQVVDYCRTRNRPLVYLSGTSVYGPVTGGPVSEDAPLNPTGPYVAAKAAGEALAARSLESCAVLRVAAPYGPEMTARTVLKIFLDNARAGRDLTYHGSGGREQVFVHVADVARSVLAALELLRRASGSGGTQAADPRRIFNIAGSEAVSMKDLAGLIVRLAGTGSQARPSGRPDPQENYRPRFSLRAAAEVLGWRPLVSLEEGLRAWLAGTRPPC